jgi:flagellin
MGWLLALAANHFLLGEKMSKINTNVNALTATNALTKNSRDMQLTMQRLSTGQRINGASDDAAGIAIATTMTAQINGLNAAVRNANDAMSMLQTADGALSETSSLVQRMRELAVLAINDTYSTTQKSAMNTEFTALAAQITSIATTTQWNGMYILNGSGGASGTGTSIYTFQVGANTAQTVTVTITSMGSGRFEFDNRRNWCCGQCDQCPARSGHGAHCDQHGTCHIGGFYQPPHPCSG